MSRRCVVVLYGERCGWAPHEGNVHLIWGKPVPVPPELPLPVSLLTRIKRWWRRG